MKKKVKWEYLPNQIRPKEIQVLREKLLKENAGICPLCNEPVIRPCLDHDHATGKIRNTICSTCNVIIGAFENKCIRMGKRRNTQEIAKNLYEYLINTRTEIHPTYRKK